MLEVNWKPNRRQLRIFGIASILVFGGLGTWIFFSREFFGFELTREAAGIVALTFWSLAGFCALSGALVPVALWPLYATLTAIGFPIGFVLSYVLLGVLFYGFLSPLALFFRIIGRDPLCRKFDPEARTYWVRRDPLIVDVKRYFRQF